MMQKTTVVTIMAVFIPSFPTRKAIVLMNLVLPFVAVLLLAVLRTRQEDENSEISSQLGSSLSDNKVLETRLWKRKPEPRKPLNPQSLKP